MQYSQYRAPVACDAGTTHACIPTLTLMQVQHERLDAQRQALASQCTNLRRFCVELHGRQEVEHNLGTNITVVVQEPFGPC